MKKRMGILGVVLAVVILISCGGGGGSKKLQGTVWLGEYGTEKQKQWMTGFNMPVRYLNKAEFSDKDSTISFNDDFKEYAIIEGREYEIGKNGMFTIYLQPKKDVLDIKKKEPGKWEENKKELLLEGKIENDTLMFPSRHQRSNEGKRVFTKISPEELKKITQSVDADFGKLKEEYDKEVEAYNKKFK